MRPLRGAFRALRVGGRFVGELGGHANVAAITVALVATLERRGIRDARFVDSRGTSRQSKTMKSACGGLGLCRKLYN